MATDKARDETRVKPTTHDKRSVIFGPAKRETCESPHWPAAVRARCRELSPLTLTRKAGKR